MRVTQMSIVILRVKPRLKVHLYIYEYGTSLGIDMKTFVASERKKEKGFLPFGFRKRQQLVGFREAVRQNLCTQLIKRRCIRKFADPEIEQIQTRRTFDSSAIQVHLLLLRFEHPKTSTTMERCYIMEFVIGRTEKSDTRDNSID